MPTFREQVFDLAARLFDDFDSLSEAVYRESQPARVRREDISCDGCRLEFNSFAEKEVHSAVCPARRRR